MLIGLYVHITQLNVLKGPGCNQARSENLVSEIEQIVTEG